MIEDIVDKLRISAIDELKNVTEQERINWNNHPITLALKRSIEADKLDIYLNWENGAFTVDSIDGTKQLNSKALGIVDLSFYKDHYFVSLNPEKYHKDFHHIHLDSQFSNQLL